MHYWMSQLEAAAKTRRAAEQARRDENASRGGRRPRAPYASGRSADPTAYDNSNRRAARGTIAVVASVVAEGSQARQLPSGRTWRGASPAWFRTAAGLARR